MKYNKDNKPLVCMMTQSTCYKQTRKMNVKGILWHSTGANNPRISRYVQPDDGASDRSKWLTLLGKNTYNNDWNHTSVQAGLNAWVGKLADGTVTTVQTMPWDYRPWGCGSGPKGSCNDGWIQFEICEDGLLDASYALAAYNEAVQLTAYLCEMFNIDPEGTTTLNGVKVPTILCHADSYKLGLGSNHGDVLHWFPKFGKTMASVRTDVKSVLSAATVTKPQPATTSANTNTNINTSSNNGATINLNNNEQEAFNKLMNNWLQAQAEKDSDSWSYKARQWAESKRYIVGDESGKKQYKKFMTKEEVVQLLYNILGQ